MVAAGADAFSGRAADVKWNDRSRKEALVRKTIQVLGELLLTVGVILLLFVGWDLWWTNVVADHQQDQAVQNFARDLKGPTAPVKPPKPGSPEDFGQIPVTQPAGHGEMIGVVYIPRFGADYSRPLIEGTSQDVLDTLGLGHYDQTSMPGAVGNFALAGHRQTHGAVLDNIHLLQPGDHVYVQTRQGYYTYVYRNTEIVLPRRVDVLLPVPTDPQARPKERLMTMTSCNPRFGSEERIIAYSALESWRPLSAGPPQEIAARVAHNAGNG
ncbi:MULTISPECIES: class E sortase [Arthrobacter]|uniref:Class E sortase n=2 Tax=Arthrobacter TaxID=1663 RepID=A0ABU9KJ37_9MICC|nr:class E sortase [Arthrobacter sp. YJM1]MDP5226924.1 class E sortase [Arthrobacter sp. YJM1]